MSLCRSCESCREIVSGKGSKFFLCEHGLKNSAWPKYPPQPLFQCSLYQKAQPKPQADGGPNGGAGRADGSLDAFKQP